MSSPETDSVVALATEKALAGGGSVLWGRCWAAACRELGTSVSGIPEPPAEVLALQDAARAAKTPEAPAARPRGRRKRAAAATAPAAPAPSEVAPVEVVDLDLGPYPAPSDPMKCARRLIRDLFTIGISGGETRPVICHWRGDWYLWCSSHWKRHSVEYVRGRLWRHLDGQAYEKDGDLLDWSPTRAKIADVLEALQFSVALDDDVDAPSWIGGSEARPAAEFVPMANLLLHWPSRQVLAPSPDLFVTWSLEFAYDPAAVCPLWESFIAQTFENDSEGALAVQEFFGYSVSGDCSRQKGLMILGPPGGGKSVLSRVMRDLIGEPNVQATDPNSLRGEFGLWPLIGKSLVVVADARSDGYINSTALGRLLNIIGQDSVAINRKGASFWNGYLPARVVWISNEIPRFTDPSGAILRRWIVVRLTRAVAEADQDPQLTAKLRAELPGILNWSLAGLDRLSRAGRFTTPESQRETLEEIRDVAAPVASFIEDRYEITGDRADVLSITEVRLEYLSWAAETGREDMNRDTLMGRISACPLPVTAKRTKTPGGRFGKTQGRYVFGIRVKAPEFP
ncbi:DNA primase family protein [Corynebacterium flavescens]|uniref:DNA primase family protein n=1 Tax=Corynebacterium flavescens TaxID=28028 RepID=UPI003FD39041